MVKAPTTTFRPILKTQRQVTGTNIGFRARNNTMYTTYQPREKALEPIMDSELVTTPCIPPLKPRDKALEPIMDSELVTTPCIPPKIINA